jgi:hypothetical protein
MCPDGSTRPVLNEENGVYTATWTKPDGTNVSAVWTSALRTQIKMEIKGNPEYYNCKGDKIQVDPDKFIVKSEVTYIVGAKK